LAGFNFFAKMNETNEPSEQSHVQTTRKISTVPDPVKFQSPKKITRTRALPVPSSLKETIAAACDLVVMQINAKRES
jgi:hypothetical protein